MLVPAILCGAITATKYNQLLLVLPFALACVDSRSWRRTGSRLLLLALATALGFLAFQPFSVLDHQQFVADVQFEMQHYRTGHAGHEAQAGLAQLTLYAKDIAGEYPLPLRWLGLLGVIAGARRNARVVLLLLAYPLALLGLMALQTVHFARSILPVVAVSSLFIAYGALSVVDLFSAGLRRAHVAPPLAAAVAWFFVAVGLGVLMPAQRPKAIVRDSRLIAADWLREHAKASCVVLLPEKLGFDPGTLPASCRTVSMARLDTELRERLAELRASPTPRQLFLITAQWGFDRRRPAGKAVAERWSNALEGLEAQLHLSTGASTVLVNYATIEMGNPKLMLYELRI